MSSQEVKYPFEFKPLDKDINEQLLRDFRGERTGYYQVGPKNWLLPTSFKSHAMDFYDMNLKKDDVFLICFPRCGVTLSQELVWLINNDLDYEAASSMVLERRFPNIESPAIFHEDICRDIRQMEFSREDHKALQTCTKSLKDILAEIPNPRHFKTHLPFTLLPPNLLEKCKTIYVARNPKDVAVSLYHHNRLHKNRDYVNEFPQFWKYFINGQVMFTPYFPHVEEAWSRRHHPNLLFLYYEDIVKDMRRAIVKVAKFLGKSMSGSDIERLADHLKIDNFRKNPSVNRDYMKNAGFLTSYSEPFIRKGQVGGNTAEWADEKMREEANQWVLENVKKYGLHDFPIV